MADDPLETLAKRVKILAKTMLQQSADELAVAYNENFGTDLKGNRTRAVNATKRLRIYKGNLARAVSGKDEPGAIFKVSIVGSEIVVESGVDDKVVPYARIHELGGTIKHPGGTAYEIVGEGRARFVSNAKATSDMERTKPHSITIPARPYLKPGMEQYIKESLPRNIKRLMKMLGAT